MAPPAPAVDCLVIPAYHSSPVQDAGRWGHGRALFDGVAFHGDASFDEATFYGGVWSTGGVTTFHKDALFVGATFSKGAPAALAGRFRRAKGTQPAHTFREP